jgi:hypothetical protein
MPVSEVCTQAHPHGDGAAGWARQPHRVADRDGVRRSAGGRGRRLARLAASPPASATVAVSTASDAIGHLGWPSGSAGEAGGLTRGCQGSPTWPSVGGRCVSLARADWLVAARCWCQASPTWPWVVGRWWSWVSVVRSGRGRLRSWRPGWPRPAGPQALQLGRASTWTWVPPVGRWASLGVIG